MSTLSIRRYWTMYKDTVLREGLGRTRRDRVQVLAQNAFYSGAHSVLKVLAFMLEKGDIEELHSNIEREGRKIKVLQGPRRKLQ